MKFLCKLYGVTPAGFYAWRSRGVCARVRDDEKILSKIRAIFEASRGTYGSPRIHAALKHQGINVGKKRVCRLMLTAGLQAKEWRRNRNKAAVKKFFGELPNQLINVTTSRTDQVWVGDVTYLKVAGRWRYLAVVLDRHSRRVLGWQLGKHRDLSLTTAALNQAVLQRQPAAGLIFHSDRGSEYAAYAYRDYLTRLGIVQSMKRPRVITDNAYAESFFRSLKAELIHKQSFQSDAQIRSALRAYIPRYNRTRLHSALGFRSPIDYERLAA